MALLLDRGPKTEEHADAQLVLIDLRRHDERILFGSIPGAVHIPGEPKTLVRALRRFACPTRSKQLSNPSICERFRRSFMTGLPILQDCERCG